MNPGVVVVLVLLSWLIAACALAWLVGHFCRVGAREDE